MNVIRRLAQAGDDLFYLVMDILSWVLTLIGKLIAISILLVFIYLGIILIAAVFGL